MAHIRQSRPDHGLGLQATCEVTEALPSLLRFVSTCVHATKVRAVAENHILALNALICCPHKMKRPQVDFPGVRHRNSGLKFGLPDLRYRKFGRFSRCAAQIRQRLV
jgi:hypothetical protein